MKVLQVCAFAELEDSVKGQVREDIGKDLEDLVKILPEGEFETLLETGLYTKSGTVIPELCYKDIECIPV